MLPLSKKKKIWLSQGITPLSFSGLLFWHRALISSRDIVIDGSNNVSRSNDQGDNGLDSTQTTALDQPLWDQVDTITYDGATEFETMGDPALLSGLAAFEIFIVFKQNSSPSPASFHPIIIKGGGAVGNREFSLFVNDSNNVFFVITDESLGLVDSIIGGTALDTTSFFLINAVWTGSQLELFVNNSQDATPVASAVIIEDLVDPVMFARDELPRFGDIAIKTRGMYNRALTATERNNLNISLNDIYSIF